MKTVLNHSLQRVAATVLVACVLAGCGKETSSPASQPAPAVQDRKVALLREISGVWNADSALGLTTIYYADNRLQIIEGDKPLAVTLGDVDPDEETVNVNTTFNGRDEIVTIRKKWNADHTAYNLSMIGSDGVLQSLGFVRRISNDDLNRISRLSVAKAPSLQPAPIVNTVPSAVNSDDRGVIDMWLGGMDMNMRSCPGSTCSAVFVIPKDSKLSADTSTIRNVTESSGANTPWIRVTYEGAYCLPAELDRQSGCSPSHGTEAPATGWMNYARLLESPRPQQ